jgi:hypothetical protein
MSCSPSRRASPPKPFEGNTMSSHEAHKARPARSRALSAGEASNLMRWPVQRRNRNATTPKEHTYAIKPRHSSSNLDVPERVNSAICILGLRPVKARSIKSDYFVSSVRPYEFAVSQAEVDRFNASTTLLWFNRSASSSGVAKSSIRVLALTSAPCANRSSIAGTSSRLTA